MQSIIYKTNTHKPVAQLKKIDINHYLGAL